MKDYDIPIWQGPWKVRLYERVRERGFDSPPETHEERVQRARAALRTTPPPPGWRPLGPEDELLRTLLPDEES